MINGLDGGNKLQNTVISQGRSLKLLRQNDVMLQERPTRFSSRTDEWSKQ